MNNGLIVIKQLPVIEERLRSMSKEIDEDTAAAMSLVCSKDTVASVKKVRADLNSRFKELEERRIEVKKAVLAPYEAFEAVYRECVTEKFKTADANLKGKIDEIENGLKAGTEAKLRKYYSELCTAYGIDFVPFEKLNIKITLSASEKSFKEYIEKTLSAIMDNLEVISKQEYKDEILAEYKQTLNLNQAITHITDLHASIEAERSRASANAAVKERNDEAVKKVEAFSAPTAVSAPPETDPVLTAAFRVTAKKSKLKELKQFLINGGYDFE